MNSYIHTPTPNLETSLDFYTRLGFKTLPHDSLAVVTDGAALIEINPERTARAGVRLFAADWEAVVENLSQQTNVISKDGVHTLSDPNGVRVTLNEGEPPDLGYNKQDCFSKLGQYAGISLETTDLTRSTEFWQGLGFKLTSGGPDQGWATYENEDGLGVSLMKAGSCPHLAFNPSLTYFNGGKNLPVIASIREAGIPITEEITHFNKEGIVDNVILRDPGGYGFFIFND